jgi:hypothetical protein
MKSDWRNSWTPNLLMATLILFIVLFLWKCELDFLYLYCKEWSDWIKILLFLIFPFLALFLIWDFFDWLITKWYGRD